MPIWTGDLFTSIFQILKENNINKNIFLSLYFLNIELIIIQSVKTGFLNNLFIVSTLTITCKISIFVIYYISLTPSYISVQNSNAFHIYIHNQERTLKWQLSYPVSRKLLLKLNVSSARRKTGALTQLFYTLNLIESH